MHRFLLSALSRAICALIGLLAACAAANAQAITNDDILSSGGRVYVVAFPDTTRNAIDTRYPNNRFADKTYLYIYSAIDNVVTVRGDRYNVSGRQIAAGEFATIDLTADPQAPEPIVTRHCSPVGSTFRIEAREPIIVYQVMVTRFGTEAWTPLPVEAWGNEYYAAAHPGEVLVDYAAGANGEWTGPNRMAPAEILVIAAYDDTRITIVPNAPIHTFCQPTNITLRAGEAYSIQSFVDTLTANQGFDQPDFGGSRIFSTKPVGVISGNTRAQLIDENIGLNKNANKNMLVEWLTPVDQHGTEFVYMPTWDVRRPTGSPDEDPSRVRRAELVRVYATRDGGTEGYYMQSGMPIPYDRTIEQGRFAQIRHTPNLARVHRTDKPAQATMASVAVVYLDSMTSGSLGPGFAYRAHGGSMVALTPRENWVEFAPYYAAPHPAAMEHFVNVVTDSVHRNDVLMQDGTPFVFQRAIEGTDLVWGSMPVTPGVTRHLKGRNGARFAGFVYGNPPEGGRELVRRFSVAQYEEYLAIAYAYPLAASRYLIGNGDSLGIKTETDCFGMTLTVESLDDDPVGLRSIELTDASNATIVSRQPSPLTAAVKSTVRIEPINPGQDGTATIEIVDRTGKTTRATFRYYAERVEITPANQTLDFGTMVPFTTAEQTITLRNPLDRPITIRQIGLVLAQPDFGFRSIPTLPLTLAPGGTAFIAIQASPTHFNREYFDTVVIELD
jgi:hypothetical protein